MRVGPRKTNIGLAVACGLLLASGGGCENDGGDEPDREHGAVRIAAEIAQNPDPPDFVFPLEVPVSATLTGDEEEPVPDEALVFDADSTAEFSSFSVAPGQYRCLEGTVGDQVFLFKIAPANPSPLNPIRWCNDRGLGGQDFAVCADTSFNVVAGVSAVQLLLSVPLHPACPVPPGNSASELPPAQALDGSLGLDFDSATLTR
ncbi:MAG: hypothetical protein KBD01_08170 [Acidobacteria bacterium]|nr:hypothetical protein [Acidobacteriota bacterium]